MSPTSSRSPVAIPREYTGTVVYAAAITPKIVIVKLQPKEALSYIAGQYASFLIEQYRRPLSYATPSGSLPLEFIVDISPGGVASQYVANLHEGDRVRFLSPYGRFTVPAETSRPLLFIATGSGIAPIRAQILDELTAANPRPMTLLFGNKDEQHVFLHEEFTQLAATHSAFTFIPVLSEPSSAWSGERGLVTHILLRRVAHLVDYEAFMCGNPHMVRHVRTALEEGGVPQWQIHSEQFT